MVLFCVLAYPIEPLILAATTAVCNTLDLDPTAIEPDDSYLYGMRNLTRLYRGQGDDINISAIKTNKPISPSPIRG